MSNTTIHPTAIISKKAKIYENVIIGPYCIVGDNVILKSGVKLISSVTIGKNTEIDSGTIIYPYAVIGFDPQDLKYEGEETRVVIGKNNVIREYVSIHLATKHNPTLTTTIADNCLLMGGVHIAHDCKVGNNVIIANNTLLGGHVSLGDSCIVGGGCAIHQFTRLGKLVFVGGGSIIVNDLIPYAMYTGARRDAYINGVNLIGLKRHKYSLNDIRNIRSVYKILFSNDYVFKEKIDLIEKNFSTDKVVNELLTFLKEKKSRDIHLRYRNTDI